MDYSLWIPGFFSLQNFNFNMGLEKMSQRVSNNRQQAPTKQHIDILKNRFDDLYKN